MKQCIDCMRLKFIFSGDRCIECFRKQVMRDMGLIYHDLRKNGNICKNAAIF